MTPPASPRSPAPERRRRPLAVRLLIWGVGIVAALVVAVGVAINLPFVRDWAFDYGRSILEEAGVQSASLSGSITQMSLKGVALTDDEGVWATADEIVLSWSPWGLVSGTVTADRAEIRGGRLLREPAYAPDPDQADEPFAWPDLPVDVSLASLTGDVTLDPAIVGEAVALSLNGQASLTSSGGEAELSATRADGVAGEASVTARTTADLKDLAVSVNLKDARIVAGLAGDERFQNLAVSLEGARDGMTCSGQAAVSARDGALATLGATPDCAFTVTLAEVAHILGADQGLSGPAGLTVKLLEDGADQTTQIEVAADLSKLLATDALYARLIPGAGASALVTFRADATEISNLQARLADGRITLAGAASLGAATRAAIDLTAQDLSILQPDMKGAVQARIGYDDASPTPISIDGRGVNVASGDMSWQTVSLKGSVDARGSGAVTLKGDGGAAPMDLAVRIADAFGGALAVNAKGAVASAHIDADVKQAGEAYDVKLALDTERLDRLSSLAGEKLAGALKLRLDGRVGGGAGQRIDLTADAKNASYDGTAIGDLNLTAKGPLSALAVTANGRAPAAGRTIDYRLAAEIAEFERARVTTLTAASGAARLESARAFDVSFADAVIVDGLLARLSRNGRAAGELEANATQTGAGLKGDLTARRLDLEALSAVLGMDPLKGVLEASGAFDGAAGAASLKGTIDNLRADASRTAPPVDVTIDATWANGRVAANVVGRAEGLPDATAELAFPMARAADGGVPAPSPNAALTGAVNWRGRVAPIWRLLDISGHDLDGDAAIDVRLGGALSSPRITGGFQLANGLYVNDGLGTRLAGLTLNGAMDAQTLTLTGQATDGGRGRMVIDARLPLGGGIGQASGGLTLTAMHLLARDDLSAAVDGELQLARRAEGPALTGALTVTHLEAGIPSGSPPDLIVVDVIDPANPPAPPPAAVDRMESPAPADALALDIDVRIPGPAKVEGRGLTSLWRGDLKIFGDASDPRVRGALTLYRGTLDFGSRNFALTQGEIEFDGGPTIEPRIRIVATQQEADFTASLTLSGRATDPDISVSSVPAAPQDEVFARLLFGRSVSNLSAPEALELANSIAALSGGSDVRGGVLGGLRDQFGLDVLSVDVGDGGAMTVKAGAYLMENVYFEVRQGGASGGTKGVLEIQIDENLSLETEVGGDSSSAVGARYGLDY